MLPRCISPISLDKGVFQQEGTPSLHPAPSISTTCDINCRFMRCCHNSKEIPQFLKKFNDIFTEWNSIFMENICLLLIIEVWIRKKKVRSSNEGVADIAGLPFNLIRTNRINQGDNQLERIRSIPIWNSLYVAILCHRYNNNLSCSSPQTIINV